MTGSGAHDSSRRILEDQGHVEVEVFAITAHMDVKGGYELWEFVSGRGKLRAARTARVRLWKKAGKPPKIERSIVVWVGWQDQPPPTGSEDEASEKVA